MKDTLTISAGGGAYPIVVSRGALSELSSLLSLSRRVLIVTDEGVPTAYSQAVAKVAKHPVTVTLPQGERTKSLASLELLCRTMLREGFTRSDCVVAVGGGVVGDLAGFAAATYMRGIDFYNIPTTLLSQVDSSVGGKVAVNLDGIKNCVGAFYPPRAVIIDPDTLKTLPKRHIAAGLCEALKMALTHDASFFERFETGMAQKNLPETILSALRIKKAVVEEDEKEQGLRRVLNFGHTVGHGIETLLGFSEKEGEKRLFHGECVALGMLPMCAPEVKARLLPVLRRLSLPTEISLPLSDILSACTHDKKAEKDGIQVVFVEQVGAFRFCKIDCDALGKRIVAALPGIEK